MSETDVDGDAAHGLGDRLRALRAAVDADIAAFRRERWDELSRPRYVLQYVVHVIGFTLERFADARLARMSAGLAFVTALSLVPVLVLLVSSVAALGIVENAGGVMISSLLEYFVPVEEEATAEALSELVSNAGSAYAGLVGFGVAVVTAVLLYNGIDALLNDIWRVPRRRPLGQRLLQFWSFLTLAPALIAASIVVSGRIQFVLQQQFGSVSMAEAIVPTLFPVFLAAVGIFVMLKVIPHTTVSWWAAAMGALVAAILIEIGKVGFAWYVGQVVRVTWFRVYGALFLVPVLLLWINLSWMIIAFGAQLAYVLQHLRALLRETDDSALSTRPLVSATVALSLAEAMASSWRRGDGPITATALCDAARVPESRGGEVLAAWCDAGLVAEAGQRADSASYLPQRPLERVTLLELLDACGCVAPQSDRQDAIGRVLRLLRAGDEAGLAPIVWASLGAAEPDDVADASEAPDADTA